MPDCITEVELDSDKDKLTYDGYFLIFLVSVYMNVNLNNHYEEIVCSNARNMKTFAKLTSILNNMLHIVRNILRKTCGTDISSTEI